MKSERNESCKHHGPQFPAATPCGRGFHATAAKLSTHDVRPNLQEWLLEHREQFITFMLEETAEIAVISGYSQDEVDRWFNRKDPRFI
jgi:hypothetical protein